MKKIILLTFVAFSSLSAEENFNEELKKIIERAERIWPLDYEMQNYEVKKQTQAYKKMNELKRNVK